MLTHTQLFQHIHFASSIHKTYSHLPKGSPHFHIARENNSSVQRQSESAKCRVNKLERIARVKQMMDLAANDVQTTYEQIRNRHNCNGNGSSIETAAATVATATTPPATINNRKQSCTSAAINQRAKFNQTTSTALFLYIYYTLNIYLIWTNCVIFTESAQHKFNIDPISNLLHYYQRFESNNSHNSNNNNSNNLKSNFDDYPSYRGIRKFSDGGSDSESIATSITANDKTPDYLNYFKWYFQRNFSKNSQSQIFDLNPLNNRKLLAAASSPTLSSQFDAHMIHINRNSRKTAMSTPSRKRLDERNRLKRNSPRQMDEIGFDIFFLRTEQVARMNGVGIEEETEVNSTKNKTTSGKRIVCNVNTRNEFRRFNCTKIRIKRNYPSENVIKSPKNHAIKRNVNNFTPDNLDIRRSNLSIINSTIKMTATTIISNVLRPTTTSPTPPSTPATIKQTSSSNESELTTIKSIVTATTPLHTTMAKTSRSPVRLLHRNRIVSSDDRKLMQNNTIIQLEINRNNTSRITSHSILTTMAVKTSSETASTPVTSSTPTTSKPLLLLPTIKAHESTKSILSSSTFGRRFRVNDVFEMDTKLKQNQSHGEQYRNGKKIISLLGLFELSTRSGERTEGHSELAAAEMAVRHINKQGAILPGYTLQLITNDTKCDPGVGVDRFFHALYNMRQHLTRILMLLGSACSEVTESLAKVVPYWNIVQVSFGSTSPALSDRREFPLFYRTVAPDSSHNSARIAFIRRFGWDTVTTFTQNEEIHSLAVNDLVAELENANIKCAATITFAETDFKSQLKMLRDLDTRIIIGSFSHDLAPKIFCEAFKLGMYGADYVWILHELVGPPWWQQTNHECSQKQLQEVAENLLVLSSHNSIANDEISYSGLTHSMFIDELNSMKVPHPLSRYAAQTYDAVWAIALALRGAEEKWKNDSATQFNLERFDYTRSDMALEFLHQFGRLNFLGVSGPVLFSGADRIGISVFSQVQDGLLKSIALYYPSRLKLDFECPKCVPIKWKSGQVPIAKRIFKLRVATIAPVAFFTITTLAAVGIILSIAFLAFNLHFRKLKAIKLSSPKLSNITAFGCILVYAAVILLGLDYSTLPANEKAFPVVCTARVYLLSSGFSLAFGSMFAKTYRVHRIFTRSSSVCKDKMLQDTQLISLVCALLLLDGLVVSLWVIADPMERHLSNLTLEISLTDRSVVYQPQVEVCRSQHTQTWLGALYVYKGLLLVVGVYMAWETRHVKIPALNDSQYIGVSVYSVVITSAIVVVLANLIAERVTLAFITITALILTSTTATLCLLFLPKMNDIWGKGVINDPVIHSMGLKMECNTRRFVMDDKRELQYRVEVQNRVYKKELAALDIEIGKLEKMLESPSSTSSSDMSIPRLIKHELAVVNEENEKHSKQRTPSIGGGLPLLLLSVLPPVIPRASWPMAEPMSNTMRKSVTFSSQPQLEEGTSVQRLPAIDLLHLRLTHQQAEADARRGIFDRIIGFFGSKPSSRKASTTSIAGSGGSGIANALKLHMGFFSNLVPTASTSCNAIDTETARPLRKMSLAKSGNAIDTISLSIASGLPFRARNKNLPIPPPFVISAEDDEPSSDDNQATTTAALSRKNIYVDTEHEQKVNFQLPLGRRPSIMHQPTLRERVKGSPRFPHRIAPTSSLNALVENVESAGAGKSKWKSMEDSTVFASTSSSSALNTSNS